MVQKLGPKTGTRVKEGQRVVAVPWPTAGGEGTYQQYVATPEKDLVTVSASSSGSVCENVCAVVLPLMTRFCRWWSLTMLTMTWQHSFW